MEENRFKVTEENIGVQGTRIGKEGVHFGYTGSSEVPPVLLLYKKGTSEIAEEIPFPKAALGDHFYSMTVKFSPSEYEYNFRDGDMIITDPYAKKICGREIFGQEPSEDPHSLRGGFVSTKYKWEDDVLPHIPYEDAVMYQLHLRGFTMQKNSGGRKKGTFAGVKEKIPYLAELGINQVKLLPVYDFNEMVPKMVRQRPLSMGQGSNIIGKKGELPPSGGLKDQYKLNFWGYGGGFYFAPKASYASTQNPDIEFKDMVKSFHSNGIEVILEFSFEENTDIQMISDCLTYWAKEYHVDGFSVIARESVLSELARLPLFRTRKLIANWYQNSVKSWNKEKGHALLAESNDGFMNDCRKALKGDEDCLSAFSHQIRSRGSGCAKISYMTNHDGFTMMDLVSYDRKHNLDNGEQDRDGTEYNLSWNCGLEGPSKKKEIVSLRMRQRKNAYAIMLFSQGTPMLLAGDELGNSQNGNNNPYCHDNKLSWVDWSGKKRNEELLQFVKQAIAYRKSHKVFHQERELKCADQLSNGFPDLSFHGDRAWYGDFEKPNRHLGCMYASQYVGKRGFVYVAYNFHWNPQEFALPLLPKGENWYKVMDTSLKDSFIDTPSQEKMQDVKSFTVPARTIVILEGK